MSKLNPILFLALVLFGSWAAAQSTDVLDAKNGFKDYKFGDNKNAFGRVFQRAENGVAEVLSVESAEQIGDIDINSITLYFINDALARVEAHLDVSEAANALRACKAAFGEPTANRSSLKIKSTDIGIMETFEYDWQGQKVLLTLIHVDGKAPDGKVTLRFQVADYAEQLKLAEKTKYSADDF